MNATEIRVKPILLHIVPMSHWWYIACAASFCQSDSTNCITRYKLVASSYWQSDINCLEACNNDVANFVLAGKVVNSKHMYDYYNSVEQIYVKFGSQTNWTALVVVFAFQPLWCGVWSLPNSVVPIWTTYWSSLSSLYTLLHHLHYADQPRPDKYQQLHSHVCKSVSHWRRRSMSGFEY